MPTPKADPADDPRCNRCGRGPSAEEHARLTWSSGTERGRAVVTCPGCVRDNVRSIEAKLDSDWW